jgi:serine/threonine protein kinase
MSLTAGTRLGPYEIVALLGKGGMGEVYRARDTKLNRDVAIKVLPDLFASDPDRLARFEREAQVLASLNHPHIAQIHGFEDSPSTSSGQAGSIRALGWSWSRVRRWTIGLPRERFHSRRLVHRQHAPSLVPGVSDLVGVHQPGAHPGRC